MAEEPKPEEHDDAEPTLDDSEPSPERQAELRAAYEANLAAGKAPYADVEIRTLGEVHWIMAERNWSNKEVYYQKHRANFSYAHLSGANLRNLQLLNADFSNAQMSEVILAGALLLHAKLRDAFLGDADLSNANLDSADLSGADLSFSDASNANLSGTNLTGANLSCAHLSGAQLVFANLTGASLAWTELQGASLENASMDGSTNLTLIGINERTMLRDVSWNGASLANISWDTLTAIGEERVYAEALTDTDKKRACLAAAQTYRQLSTALRNQGMATEASKFRLKEQRLSRQKAKLDRKWPQWFGSLVLDWVSGYGEIVQRTFTVYFLTIVSFTGLYLLVVRVDVDVRLRHVAWYEWPALSITSFHGRGFFPGTLPPHPWIAWLAMVEAVWGLFIEVIFIATFTRRFLNN